MRKWAAVLAMIFLALLVISIVISPWVKSLVQYRIDEYLRTEFDSDVQVGQIHVWLFPRIRVEASDVVLRHAGQLQLPPLMQIRKLSLKAGLLSLLQTPSHIKQMELDGLQLHIPARNRSQNPWQLSEGQSLGDKYPVLIETIHAENALLVTLPKQPGKKARKFPIQHLEIHNLSFGRPASFIATLTNPVPVGTIHAMGQFGPWNAVEPASTPVAGNYTFKNADLGTIHGISGTLLSDGKFDGPLDYIQVNGSTETPNFALRISNNPVNLRTQFSAIVDGTDGDTILKSVEGQFAHTVVFATGKVIEGSDHKGKRILLHAVVNRGMVQDLLRLAMKSGQPTMVGNVRLNTDLQIIPGAGDLLDRLQLAGQFSVSDARFTSARIQDKVDSLSRRGQGHPRDKDLTAVSQLRGAFSVSNASVDFSRLDFDVTGADVELTGRYNLDQGEINFHGNLLLSARVSQTTTGIKSFLLRALDPFFAKNGAGTDLPIRITGTREKPSFSLDFHHKSKSSSASQAQ